MEITNRPKTEKLFNKRESNITAPLFGTTVSCGFPSPADDYVEMNLSLDEYIIKNPPATFFVRASGCSMTPSITAGDLLVIDRSLEAKNTSIILAIVNGEFTVKRLQKRNEQICLVPDNPKHSEITITESMDFQVWGVVTHVVHSTT